MAEVYVPIGGAGRLAIQQCSRMPDPRRGFGFQKGVYHDISPLELVAKCVKGTAERLPGFDPAMLSGIILTCANPTGPQNFTGRTIATYLGWQGTWGSMLNQLCMSGLRGQLDAANILVSPFVRSQEPMVIAVAGVEKMSECRLENIFSKDYCGDALSALGPEATAMGYTAEMLSDKFGISKEDCDNLALSENRRFRQAVQAGWFGEEIVPISVGGKVVDKDAVPEELTPEIIKEQGKFYFRSPQKGAVITQFSSSQMSDGATCVILCNEAARKKYAWRPMARFVGGAIATTDPKLMGYALTAAFEEYVAWTGMSIAQFKEQYQLFEFNTAFASVPLVLIRKHGLDMGKVNIAGGATTPLGHPLGATGERLVVTLLHLMKRLHVRFGYAGACVGEGQGGGVAYENLML
jgi:acetyl-CoA acetyltransferase family protein